MRFKENVKVFGVRPEMSWAAFVAYTVYLKYGNEQNFTITSVRDGKHKRGSDHYVGNAFDLRVWGFQDVDVPVEPVTNVTGQYIADEIEEKLTDEFEVFFEGDHIHIGFDVQGLR